MILITGASGLVGSHLLKHLAETQPDERITALYHQHLPQEEYPNVTYTSCDLLDIFAVEKVMEQVQQIYHCAAIVSFNPKDKKELVDKNQTATANIVNAAVQEGVKKMIHVSSIAALGREHSTGKIAPIDEQTEFISGQYASEYSKSKYASEMEVWRGFAEGLNGAIVNPGIILGENKWYQSSGKLMTTVSNGLKWYTQGQTAFVDVKDVVNAMQMLMKAEVNNERFILSAGNFSYQFIFEQIASALGVQAPPYEAKKWMSALIWRYFYLHEKISGKQALITKETAHTAHSVYTYDNSKFLEFFPEFQYTNIQKTIERMAGVFQKDFNRK